MRSTLEQLCGEFGLVPSGSAEIAECAPIGSGHIHETWKVRVVRSDGSGAPRDFVLQRLNDQVFPDLPALIENWRRIAEHLKAVMAKDGVVDPERRCLNPIPNQTGGLVVRDGEGHAWRCSPFIVGSASYDEAPDAGAVESAARLFGGFGLALASLPAPALQETIPGFHDLEGRAEELRVASEEDRQGRRGTCGPDFDAVARVHEFLRTEFEKVGDRPIRIVHNDCKLNNALLDEHSGEGLCVVDLDTVMAGRVEYDFGELVRTAVCPAPEDEAELGRLRLEAPLFRAAVRGTLEGWRGELTAAELLAFPLSGARMAFENGIRFLADHLRGDLYFRTRHAGHNLQRARAQLRLAELFREALPWQRHIVEEEAAAFEGR